MKKLKLKLVLLVAVVKKAFEAARWVLRQDFVEVKEPDPVKEEVVVAESPQEEPMIEEQTYSRTNFKGLQEVPAERIMLAAQQVGGSNNCYHQLLYTAAVYQQLGVEPVFLITPDQSALRVAAKEVFENPKILN